MGASDRSTLAVTLSVFLATFTVIPLTSDRSFLADSWLLIAILGVLTMGLRRLQVRRGAVLGAQLLVWAGFSLALSASLPGTSDSWYDHVVTLWAAGIQHMQTQASPMDANFGVELIFVCVIGLIMVVTDLLVSGIQRPAWAIAPTALVFLVPAIGLGADTGVPSFLCIALGYLGILVAEGLNTTARWTRGLSSDTAQGQGTATPVVWRAAGLIGVPALLLTVVLGLIVPTFALSGIGFGSGPGGNGPLQLSDPALDLRRNLNQPQDKVVIEYTTDKPGGLYLRLASLPQFNSAGWGNIAMKLTPGEQLPQIPGVGLEPTERRRSTVRVLDFRSEYLPLPYAPRSFDATGNWAYDSQSLVVLSMARRDRANSIRNLSYTVESSDITPDATDLVDATAGIPGDASITAAVPRDLPESLRNTTRKVTAGADTPGLRAAKIQEYLRSDEFTYSTETLPGSGYQALENFLLTDHTGYCEQFATAMAMMARLVDIPSRVAVGFLPGVRRGDHWEVSIRDMHAWPELYFAGLGWVRFEPTPASVTGAAPGWTVPKEGAPNGAPTQSASAQPSSSASAPSTRPDSDPGAPTTGTEADTGFTWGRTLLGSGIGLVALTVLAAPATIRRRRRSGRLSNDGSTDERVEAAWEEIRDTVLDYGGSWPEGTPKTIGGEIGHRLPDGGSDTMTRVATMVERSRYARSFGDADVDQSLPGMTQDIRRGIAEPQSRWRRVRAVVAPKSLFYRRSG